jgi:Kdo2-lipid IVA lauroyltransferase/acyltransferase
MRGGFTTVRYGAEYGLIRLALALDRVLGPERSDRLAAALGRLAYRRLRIRADVVEAHLRHAFPERDEAWVQATAAESYAHLGREGIAMLRLGRLGRDDVLAAVDAPPIVDEIVAGSAAGKGTVLVTGHVGNWEVAGAYIAARGVPIDAVVRRLKNPYFHRLITRARERLGLRLVTRGGATQVALDGLANGRSIGLAADQDARRGGIFVPFLGRPASTHRGPAVLAIRTGAPLYVGMAARKPDGRYHLMVQRIPIPEEGEFEDRVRKVTETWTQALEAAVREYPEQYFWHHRRWKTTPPEAWNVVPRSEVPSGAEARPGEGE